MAGLAEDLEVIEVVCSPKSKGENVVNVPGFAGIDLLRAARASSFPLKEEVQPKSG